MCIRDSGVALYQAGTLPAESLMTCFEENIGHIEEMIDMDPEKEEYRIVKQDIRCV